MSNESKCLFISPWLNETTKIVMQIFFVVTFLSLFFFLYVVKVEKDVFDKQIGFVVDNLYDDFDKSVTLIIPPSEQKVYKEYLKNYITHIQISQDDYQDIRDNNQEIVDSTKKIVITFAFLLFAAVFAIVVLRFCTDLTHHFFENIIVLGGIALTEYLFLNLITKNYISANPNVVKWSVLDAIQQYASQRQQKR